MAHEHILIVEDEKLIRWSVKARLSEEGFVVDEADCGKRAFELLGEHQYDLVLLDHRLPDTTGLEILERVRADAPDTSAVMMTAYGTVDNAVAAMKLGAQDFLTKPVNLDELTLVITKALEVTRLRREVRRLRSEQREIHDQVDFIGRSHAMRAVLELIGKISTSQASTVLLEGDSGTGKNLVAKAIHYRSPRAEKPFVNITCSALTETLLESELFGHERGAFTDAKTQKKGLLEIAEGGTAFLDEIGEIGPSTQVKLLRFLEEKTFRRVGGTRDIQVDVRIVAATNKNLERAVREGQFREDLFYRLQVIPVRLPSLRERRDDVPLLAAHFIDQFNRKLGKDTQQISPEALARMVAYDWPGNIRELRNAIERIMILENKRCIELGDLPAAVRAVDPSRVSLGGNDDIANVGSQGLVGNLSLEEIERQAIRQALDQAGQNQVRAAKILGISRDTLRYRMKKFGLLDDSRR